MADFYGDIRPRKIDEFGNPVIPIGSLRDYATIGPPMGAYGTLGTRLFGSAAAATATTTAADNTPPSPRTPALYASLPLPSTDIVLKSKKKEDKEEIKLKIAGGQKTQQSQPHLHKQAITEKQQLKARRE